MDQHTALLLIGLVGSIVSSAIGQHFFKADPNFNTTATHAAQFIVAFGLYALANPFHATPSPETWILGGITWAMGLGIGSGSVLAGAGVIAKTDSKS